MDVQEEFLVSAKLAERRLLIATGYLQKRGIHPRTVSIANF